MSQFNSDEELYENEGRDGEAFEEAPFNPSHVLDKFHISADAGHSGRLQARPRVIRNLHV